MCRWRQVQHIYALCDHVYNLPDEMIQCEDRWCKFSTIHPSDCGPDCKKTCWQYRQFPEQYNRTFQKLCYNCEQAAAQAARRGGGGR